MSYTVINYKTKKDLVQAVRSGVIVKCFQPGLGPDLTNYTGHVALEGPHFPKPHSWYASASLENGIIIKVK